MNTNNKTTSVSLTKGAKELAQLLSTPPKHLFSDDSTHTYTFNPSRKTPNITRIAL